MNLPRVSVIIPVYNGEAYIEDAVKSILSQTYKDIEVFVIDDKSTDSTLQILEKLKKSDPRVKILTNNKEKGIVGALNTGIEASNSEYIIRMDNDDLSLPDRIKKQIDFMDKNLQIGVSGTWVKTFGVVKDSVWKLPVKSSDIKARMLFNGAIAHPTVIIRRSVLQSSHSTYRYEFQWAEDHDLWSVLSDYTDFANIPEILLRYRTHTKNVGTVHSEKQRALTRIIRNREIERIGIIPTMEELDLHCKIGYQEYNNQDRDFAERALKWFDKLIIYNLKSKTLDYKSLLNILLYFTKDIYKKSSYINMSFLKLSKNSTLYKNLSFTDKLKFKYNLFIIIFFKIITRSFKLKHVKN